VRATALPLTDTSVTSLPEAGRAASPGGFSAWADAGFTLPGSHDLAQLRREFRWAVPQRYNIGVDIADRWGLRDPNRPAILEVRPDGGIDTLTFGGLRERSNRLAHVLRARGIGPSDRVAVLLQQGAAVPIAHAAIYKLGAIALPLAAVFGTEGLLFRLSDAGAKAVITGSAGLAKIRAIHDRLPGLETLLSIHGPDGTAEGLYEAMERASPDFEPVDTAADDPALMIYTSGTTGQP
jgi:acetyl-CoA synthetase